MKTAEDRTLSDELKQLISQGQEKVNEVRAAVKSRGVRLDMTCKRQLIDDCKNVEKSIKKIYKGNNLDKDTEQLKLSILLLETSSNGILYNKSY